jgi:ERCC4-related helicase
MSLTTLIHSSHVKLYPHQVDCLKSLQEAFDQHKPGFAISHEMGLGKTLTTLSFLVNKVFSTPGFRALIVVPTVGVMDQWLDQFHTFFSGYASWIHYYHGNKRVLDPKAPFHLVTRGTLSSDFRRGISGVVDNKWTCIVWDEAHYYSNLVTRSSDSIPAYGNLVKYINREINIVVTGTPYKNDPTDIKSLMLLMGFELSNHMKSNELAAFWLSNSHRCTSDDVLDSLPTVVETVIKLDYPTSESSDMAKELLSEVKKFSKQLGALMRSNANKEIVNQLKAALAKARSRARMCEMTVFYTSNDEFDKAMTTDPLFMNKMINHPKLDYIIKTVQRNMSKKFVIASDFTAPLKVFYFLYNLVYYFIMSFLIFVLIFLFIILFERLWH